MPPDLFDSLVVLVPNHDKGIVTTQLVFARAVEKAIVIVPAEELSSLSIPQNWQKYPKLNYIYDMKSLF